MEKKTLTDYLKSHKLIDVQDEVLEISKPGEGNMNFVSRVTTMKTTLIIKQANGFVQKYPEIPAPKERILVEGTFYKTVENYPSISKFLPNILLMDNDHYVLGLEDLGKNKDFTSLYRRGQALDKDNLWLLLNFLNQLHNKITIQAIQNFPDNLKLRKLNHEHLFVYPFLKENGFSLDTVLPGLQNVALKYKTDSTLFKKLAALGEIYLRRGNTLLHGDYYPGSWLQTDSGIKIIDPEFCFIGPREFEMGIFMAHIILSQSPHRLLEFLVSNYDSDQPMDWVLARKFMGVEILRRIIGLAQLPLELSLDEREDICSEAFSYIMI